MPRLFRAIVFSAVVLLSSTAFARVTAVCEVSSKSARDVFYGSAVQREVDFLTGRELIAATGQYSFSSFDYYALLWFSQSEVAILKHDGFAMGAGDRRFERINMDRLFGTRGSAEFEQVNGSARDYKIECKKFGRWIDRSL